MRWWLFHVLPGIRSRRSRPLVFLALMAALVLTLVAFQHLGLLLMLKLFEYQIHVTPAEKAVFLELLNMFINITRRRNIPYSIYSGTLLGLARYKDMMPWDDDFDVMMHEEHCDQVAQDVSDLVCAEKLQDCTERTLVNCDRLKGIGLLKISKTGKWPYLDVMLMRELPKQKLLLDTFEGFHFNTADIFPLREADFLGRNVSVPNNIDHVLEVLFGRDALRNCKLNYYNHRLGTTNYVYALSYFFSVDCQRLRKLFHKTTSAE